IAAQPDAVGPRLLQVNDYIDRKQGPKAVDAAREIVRLAPANVDGLDALARSQTVAGDLQGATSTLRQPVTILPGPPGAHHKLAAALLQAKDEPGARRELQAAIDASADYLPAQRDLVALEFSSKSADDALKLAQTVRAKNPNTAFGDILVGDVQFAAQRFSE